MLTIDNIRKELTKIVKKEKETVEEFKKDIDKNFGSALKWSYGLFVVAALQQEAKYLLDSITTNKKLTPGDILAYLEKELLLETSCFGHSSSPTSNLWDESKLTAKAKLIRIIKGEF